ncbi:MAG: hypothetical protein ACFFB3_09805 [Candidatus Hodarchaeota archaeon]
MYDKKVCDMNKQESPRTKKDNISEFALFAVLPAAILIISILLVSFIVFRSSASSDKQWLAGTGAIIFFVGVLIVGVEALFGSGYSGRRLTHYGVYTERHIPPVRYAGEPADKRHFRRRFAAKIMTVGSIVLVLGIILFLFA